MNEHTTPNSDDDATFANEALSMLAPVAPSAELAARVLAIPERHPRARVLELVLRRSSVVALAAAALLGLLAGSLLDLDSPRADQASAELSSLDLPYGFDFTTSDLEGLDP